MKSANYEACHYVIFFSLLSTPPLLGDEATLLQGTVGCRELLLGYSTVNNLSA
jgi:hypothetical protein